MPGVAYIPFTATRRSVEAEWLGDGLSVRVHLCNGPDLNGDTIAPLNRLSEFARTLLDYSAVVAEGPGGFLWAAVLRCNGFDGNLTVLPYVNAHRWYHVAAVSLYRQFARPEDRVFLGSTPSASLYRSLGLDPLLAEPYGIDETVFFRRQGPTPARANLGIPDGKILLYAGRCQPDKDIYKVLRVGLRARVLFPDLNVVIATHAFDDHYMRAATCQLGAGSGVRFLRNLRREELAELYNAADAYVSASTSKFETFGRAPAEALACGAPAIAPSYDGFNEVLSQLGGRVVPTEIDPQTGAPEVNEELLLRAVYEVLSDPQPHCREEIAASARQRFGRSTTIRALGYLAGEAPTLPSSQIRPAGLVLPEPWAATLAQAAYAEDPLRWFWAHCADERLTKFDGRFAAAVRRALMSSASGIGVQNCP